MILEQVLLRDDATYPFVVFVVFAPSAIRKIAIKEDVEELLEHWVVHACSPVDVRSVSQLRVRDAPPDRAENRVIPGVHVARGENHFGLWVGCDELLAESDRWPITYCLPAIRVRILYCGGRTMRVIREVDLLGSVQEADPTPVSQRCRPHHTWQRMLVAIRGNPRGSRHSRSSYGRYLHNPAALKLLEVLAMDGHDQRL